MITNLQLSQVLLLPNCPNSDMGKTPFVFRRAGNSALWSAALYGCGGFRVAGPEISSIFCWHRWVAEVGVLVTPLKAGVSFVFFYSKEIWWQNVNVNFFFGVFWGGGSDMALSMDEAVPFNLSCFGIYRESAAKALSVVWMDWVQSEVWVGHHGTFPLHHQGLWRRAGGNHVKRCEASHATELADQSSSHLGSVKASIWGSVIKKKEFWYTKERKNVQVVFQKP